MAEKSKAHKVLVVDDEAINIELLGNLLSDEVTVIVATNGEDALTIAKSNTLGLVLLDIMMPGMDGYQVCRALKSDPETAKIPVIFITSKDEVHEEAFGLELGAVDYITKPFNPQIVKSKVKNHLANLPGAGAGSPAAGGRPSSAKRPAWIWLLAVAVILLGIVATNFSGEDTGPPPETVAPRKAEAPPKPVAPPVQAKEGDARPMAEVLGFGWVLKTKCGPIPDVESWKFRTHKAIAGYVMSNYSGAWTPYIEGWIKRLAKLQDMAERDSTAVTRTGIPLRGEQLAAYIEQTKQRLMVLHCLAGEASAAKAR